MKTISQRSALSVVILASSLMGVGGIASAQSNSSLEDAWHQCMERTLQQVGSEPELDQQRVAVFKACMASMGHAEGR